MNKRVLITGGAKGLGKSIAAEFAENGWDVIITYYQSKQEALSLCDELKNTYKIDATCEYLDITNEECINNLVEKIDYLDSLINNAAYNYDCNVFEKDKSHFMLTFNTNVIGPFLLSQKLYENLKESNGSIVNIASTNGIDSMYKESIDYDASKAALINLTKNLANAFAPQVRVNAIAPGWIETPNTEDMALDFRGKELSKIALHRFANPEEIAKLVYFISTDNASYMTGSIIRIDGGRA